MWKYTHTDEMYHSLTSQNNPDVLYHSDTYLGETYEDGLKHFKYIKREFVNGRWKYYYSNEEYNAAKKANITASNNAKKLNKQYTQAREAHERNLTALDKATVKRKMAYGFKENSNGLIGKYKANKKYNKAVEETSKAFKNATSSYDKQAKAATKSYEADQKAVAAKANYNKVNKKTKVHRAVGTGIVKTANTVSDTVYNTKKKIKKGKKAVKNALKKKK